MTTHGTGSTVTGGTNDPVAQTSSLATERRTGLLLEARNITAGYRGRAAIEDISISVGHGEAVGIIGHNGAGKTTLLNTVFGAILPMQGEISFQGKPLPANRQANIRAGLAIVPADRFVFASLTVKENLQIARRNARDAASADSAEEASEKLFPVVWERQKQLAGSLSGGERRMLSIAMSLMWQPELLLLDEPTVGLAPALAERVFDTLKALADDRGMSILCVEQSLHHLLRVVDRVYIIRNGRLIGEETAASLVQRTDYWDLF
jgi:branched-chain amino acid transport system ATP-binding protein